MKKMLLFVVIIAAGLAACNTRSGQDPSKTLSEADTAGLADFQEWKMLNERKDASLYMQPAAPVSTVKKTSAPANTVNTVPAPQKAKKQGWSKAAKGTAIGTATGATAGAIIFKKNRLLGGVIGGVVGGGLGYVIGHKMDKNDGRY